MAYHRALDRKGGRDACRAGPLPRGVDGITSDDRLNVYASSEALKPAGGGSSTERLTSPAGEFGLLGREGSELIGRRRWQATHDVTVARPGALDTPAQRSVDNIAHCSQRFASSRCVPIGLLRPAAYRSWFG